MKTNRGLIFIVLLMCFSKATAMFYPFLIPVYSHTPIMILNTEPDKLTRKWVNWVYAQNPSITSSTEVRSNIDYYHDMIKNHYKNLVFKKQNENQIKNNKLKRLAILSIINATIWTAALYFFNEALNTPRYQSDIGNFFLACSASALGIFSLAFNYAGLRSYQKHDMALSRNLKRDEHMLQQFEEYKAAGKTQNTHI